MKKARRHRTGQGYSPAITMKTHAVLLHTVLTTLIAVGAQAGVALKLVPASADSKSLLRNGGFENLRDNQPVDWRRWQGGFRIAEGEGRSNSVAVVCENTGEKTQFGVGQTVSLDRSNTAPIVVRGWSKAENVNGSADSGYALYVDLVYADGTPLWGQTASFRCGSHDWQQRELIILPEKPVKSLTLYCLFRGHTGKVWFDDVHVSEVQGGGGASLFQGVPVIAQPSPPTALPVHQIIERPQTAGLLMARDVASNSDFHYFEQGSIPALALKANLTFESNPNHIAVSGRLASIDRKDRAITMVFALPLDAAGWHWGDDIRRSRAMTGSSEFANQISVRCGSTGTMSLYPIGAVWSEKEGVAIGLDMAQPAIYRVGYHAGLKLLFIAYDFGLAADTERFPASANFRFVLYRFNPTEGFRSAFQQFTEIFPDHFAARSTKHGLWMPFTDVSKVQGWEDFGFRYHEGNNNVPWDDAHEVLSFRYTEPMTWWMAMKKDLARTPSEALRVRDELAASKTESQRRMAEVSRLAGMFDEVGQPALKFQDTPWCNGAVWSLNPNPFLGSASSEPDGDNRASETNLLNAATVHWNPTIKEKLYGPKATGRLDGEYLDSLEGYVTADLNFRRDHFRHTTVPLAFATDTHQPALFKGLGVFEFTKWISEDVHRMGHLMFANGVPYRFTFLCPWLDVLGTETDWLHNGQYRPASLTTMDLWRTMSGTKPYLLLMNTDYDRFTPDLVEEYFNRCLFYGMWPGFFSHNASENPYWQNPKWYERDRPLFKKFIPQIRSVSEAGWRPVTGATCDNPNILVERYGPNSGGEVFFTVYNDTKDTQNGTLLTQLPSSSSTIRSWTIQLQPQQASVIRCPPSLK